MLVDCVTLWLNNFFYDLGSQVEPALEQAKQEFDALIRQNATFIFVTNEIGLGGTSANDIQRHFTDLLGWMNQHVASRADEVILMVCGVPVRVK